MSDVNLLGISAGRPRAEALALNEAKELNHIGLPRACLWPPFFSPLLLPNLYSSSSQVVVVVFFLGDAKLLWTGARPGQRVAVPHPSFPCARVYLLPCGHAEPGMRLMILSLPNQTMTC